MIYLLIPLSALITWLLTRAVTPTPPKEGEFDAMAQFQINMDNNKKHEDEKPNCVYVTAMNKKNALKKYSK